MPPIPKSILVDPAKGGAIQLPPEHLMFGPYSKLRDKSRQIISREAGDDIYANPRRLPHGMIFSSVSTWSSPS